MQYSLLLLSLVVFADTCCEGLLKQATLPVYNHQKCNESNEGGVTDNMICAGFEQGGHDSCQVSI